MYIYVKVVGLFTRIRLQLVFLQLWTFYGYRVCYLGTFHLNTICFLNIGKIKNGTHGLVFMLGGIFTRWKLPVAYHFTPDSVDGAILKPIIETIIEKAEAIGLYVHSITSDMGPLNLGIWKAFGIVCNRYSKIHNYIVHPIDNTRHLFFIADAPHLLKNLKASLLNNKIIKLSTEFVQTHIIIYRSLLLSANIYLNW